MNDKSEVLGFISASPLLRFILVQFVYGRGQVTPRVIVGAAELRVQVEQPGGYL